MCFVCEWLDMDCEIASLVVFRVYSMIVVTCGLYLNYYMFCINLGALQYCKDFVRSVHSVS